MGAGILFFEKGFCFMELLAFILYFAAMLLIGIYFFFKSKKTSDNSEKEYFLGGRAMGPWVTAMSAQASDMSAWLLMGLPGSILAFGMGKAWIGIGLAIGTALNWIFCAKRLRKFSKAANDAITLPQYLSNRFDSKKPYAEHYLCGCVFNQLYDLRCIGLCCRRSGVPCAYSADKRVNGNAYFCTDYYNLHIFGRL